MVFTANQTLVQQQGIVLPGRYTAEVTEPIVVFLIGMRVNNFFAFRKWTRAAGAMTGMLNVLATHSDKGMLWAHNYFWPYPLSFMLQSYWRSFEDLERFARDKSDPHLEAWRRFNREVGADGSVGIWHETYKIEPGESETVYGNMPLFGLAAATKSVPATGRRETARRRLGGENQPAVDTPQQSY
ncbi:MAG: DUF4188 domain-containing protein [Burkholderiales bacterium]|nr:DUF4188 domain-containing protein [Anaerolineae bacterium]